MLTACSCTVHHTNQAHHGQHAARIANINECWDNKHTRTHTHRVQSQLRHTLFMCSVQWRTSHSPHGAVRPGAYLLEPCVFLRDFPHRAVDFLPGKIRLSLHDAEDKAKLEKKKKNNFSPFTSVTSGGEAKHCSTTTQRTLHLASVRAFQNNVPTCGSGDKQLANMVHKPWQSVI